jgi:hypothetical protein
MPRNTKPKHDLSKDLGFLLGDLCRDWGFCNRLSAADLDTAGGVLTAIDFARAVLQAEGMNPESEANWDREIRERFVERLGPSVSEESYAQRKAATD